jgi:hypothetical protein
LSSLELSPGTFKYCGAPLPPKVGVVETKMSFQFFAKIPRTLYLRENLCENHQLLSVSKKRMKFFL